MFTTLTKHVNNQTHCRNYCFGKVEENMDLSHIYLAVPCSLFSIKPFSRDVAKTCPLLLSYKLIFLPYLFLSGYFLRKIRPFLRTLCCREVDGINIYERKNISDDRHVQSPSKKVMQRA